MTEMKQRLRALRIGSSGSPEGMISRLLNYIAQLLPNSVLGAMQEITLIGQKPDILSKTFLIFINKPNSSKICHKKLIPITLISNLLKITFVQCLKEFKIQY